MQLDHTTIIRECGVRTRAGRGHVDLPSDRRVAERMHTVGMRPEHGQDAARGIKPDQAAVVGVRASRVIAPGVKRDGPGHRDRSTVDRVQH